MAVPAEGANRLSAYGDRQESMRGVLIRGEGGPAGGVKQHEPVRLLSAVSVGPD